LGSTAALQQRLRHHVATASVIRAPAAGTIDSLCCLQGCPYLRAGGPAGAHGGVAGACSHVGRGGDQGLLAQTGRLGSCAPTPAHRESRGRQQRREPRQCQTRLHATRRTFRSSVRAAAARARVRAATAGEGAGQRLGKRAAPIPLGPGEPGVPGGAVARTCGRAREAPRGCQHQDAGGIAIAPSRPGGRGSAQAGRVRTSAIRSMTYIAAGRWGSTRWRPGPNPGLGL
jgi:hypothetical protein